MLKLEQDLIAWLAAATGVPVHFQHLDRKPADVFVWFIRNGDESADTIDQTGDPDVVYFDLEAYASSLTEAGRIADVIRGLRDYRGAVGTGWVDDVDFQDQRDDYEPQANAESLPDYAVSFRMVVTGYEETVGLD